MIPTELIVRTSSQRRPPRTTVSPPADRREEDVLRTTQASLARKDPAQSGRNSRRTRGAARIHHPWCVTQREPHSYDGRTTPRTAATRQVREVHGGATVVEGSMTQGAGQGPEVRTRRRSATVRRPAVPVRARTQVHRVAVRHRRCSCRAGAPAAPQPRLPGRCRTSCPEGYTPTARDLPVINRGDTRSHVRRSTRCPTRQAPARRRARPAVRRRRRPRLSRRAASRRSPSRASSTPTATGRAGNARLWFLGDFTDRGPDGIGVIDLVMRLSAEAAAAGGYCKALMGNHELLLLGAKRFGDTPVNSGAGTATFQAAWLLNGGQKTDMDRLQDHHLQWMARLDAVDGGGRASAVHSDTTAYLDYGDSIEAVNDTVRETLTRNDADEVLGPVPQVHQALRLPRRGRLRRPYANCSTRTAATASSTATAPSRICWARSAPRTARTATRPRRRGPARLRRRAGHRHGRRRDHGRKAAGRSNFPWIAERSGQRAPTARNRTGPGPNFRKPPVTAVP